MPTGVCAEAESQLRSYPSTRVGRWPGENQGFRILAGTRPVATSLTDRTKLADAGMLPVHRDVVGFLIKHLLAGSVGGILLACLILWHDVAGLASMIFASPVNLVALCMLFFGLFVTFGSVAIAVAVMGLGEERDSDPVDQPPMGNQDQ